LAITAHLYNPQSPLDPSSTAIGLRKYRIPSDLRSQAEYRLVSTTVGDHVGILGAVVFAIWKWRDGPGELLFLIASMARGTLQRVAWQSSSWTGSWKRTCKPGQSHNLQNLMDRGSCKGTWHFNSPASIPWTGGVSVKYRILIHPSPICSASHLRPCVHAHILQGAPASEFSPLAALLQKMVSWTGGVSQCLHSSLPLPAKTECSTSPMIFVQSATFEGAYLL
jgi:hypothetical protein